ncbi:MAG: ubiquinone/menaquinone biosynthesis C-methylase UbiE [Bradymonadia bacterium]|jgi:ubiquinone/menaquinone biosynthesis C-methylase UbiE
MANDVTTENFEEWNEAMIREFDPDDYHNHPSPIVRLIERRRVDKILEELQVRPGSKVLEVGCGAGNILERISDAELHGVDISDYIIEKARKRLGRRATIIKGDAEALPYEDQSFDRVYCSEVLEHVLNPEKVIAEMRRVLTHNGVAVVSVPNEAVINRLKQVVFRTGPIGRFILQADKEGYESVENMEDHWHLHEFDEALLREKIGDSFAVEVIHAVPVRGLPLRLVAKLRPR